MKYQDPKFELYGYYFGRVDVHFISDGNGILCCIDGKLLDGMWEKGMYISDEVKNRKTTPAIKLLITDNFNTSALTCDASMCSSLSNSVNRRILISRGALRRKKADYDVPSQIYVVASIKSVHSSTNTGLSFRTNENEVRRKMEP